VSGITQEEIEMASGNIKSLTLIIVLALFSNTAFAIEDTLRNRSKEADHYLSVVPPNETLQDIAKQMALNYPPEEREFIIKAITQYMDIKAVTKSLKDAMIKIYSADELAALAEFYGSPVGKSATKKVVSFTAEILPTMQAETLKVMSMINRDDKGPEDEDKIKPTKAIAGSQWYSFAGETCIEHSSPADFIRLFQAYKKIGASGKYKVTEKKIKNGKPQIVHIAVGDGDQSVKLDFYRSKALCNADLSAKNRKEEAELGRYK